MDNKILIAIGILILVVVFGVFVGRMDFSVPENGELSFDEKITFAEEWMKSLSPTYVFDGQDLRFVSAREVDGGVEVVFGFLSSAAGYGDRSDEMVAQVTTPHITVIVVGEYNVISAITDEVYDEVKGEMIVSEETSTVDVYFVVVEDIVSVKREVSLENKERESLVELLKGPTTEEIADGFSTAIDEETELISLDIQGGVVYVNFSAELNVDGGSAWVMMIRDQITKTLMQFEGVEDVIIFVEGDSEEVLQP